MSFSGNFTVLMAETKFRIDQHAKIISNLRHWQQSKSTGSADGLAVTQSIFILKESFASWHTTKNCFLT